MNHGREIKVKNKETKDWWLLLFDNDTGIAPTVPFPSDLRPCRLCSFLPPCRSGSIPITPIHSVPFPLHDAMPRVEPQDPQGDHYPL